MKTEPSPGRLSTEIVPPIRSTSPLAMLSPRPVPSTRVASLLREKGSNIEARNSSDIPIPVSRTTKR